MVYVHVCSYQYTYFIRKHPNRWSLINWKRGKIVPSGGGDRPDEECVYPILDTIHTHKDKESSEERQFKYKQFIGNQLHLIQNNPKLKVILAKYRRIFNKVFSNLSVLDIFEKPEVDFLTKDGVLSGKLIDNLSDAVIYSDRLNNCDGFTFNSDYNYFNLFSINDKSKQITLQKNNNKKQITYIYIKKYINIK